MFRTAYGPGERHEPHAHAYTSVSVVLAGSLVERVGGLEEHAGPLSVVVKPAGTEHADTFGPSGAVLLRLELPPGWTGTQEEGTADLVRWRWGRSPAAARWLLRLASGGCDSPCPIDDGIAECLGALDPLPSGAEAVPDWLRRVRERIRDEQGRGAGVGELAREAGVHPVYLTRRFRRAFGRSVVAFRQEERVRAAAHEIASGDEALSRIAYGAGFADQPHLTRAFRRVSGLTPAAYRQLARVQPQVGNLQAEGGARR